MQCCTTGRSLSLPMTTPTTGFRRSTSTSVLRGAVGGASSSRRRSGSSCHGPPCASCLPAGRIGLGAEAASREASVDLAIGRGRAGRRPRARARARAACGPSPARRASRGPAACRAAAGRCPRRSSPASQKREESGVSTSSPSTMRPAASSPNSIFVSAMRMPRSAAIVARAVVDARASASRRRCGGLGADDRGRPVEVDVLVVALLGLRRGREDRRVEAHALGQTGGQARGRRRPPCAGSPSSRCRRGSRGRRTRPGTCRRRLHEHGAPASTVAWGRTAAGISVDVRRDEVVGHDVGQLRRTRSATRLVRTRPLSGMPRARARRRRR